MMKAGETKRFDCVDCGTEFEVTYEPKAKTDKASAAAMEDSPATHCPFCGEPIDEEDATG
jgi:hypothetical protein